MPKGISDEQVARWRRSAESGPLFPSLVALEMLDEIERQRKAIREIAKGALRAELHVGFMSSCDCAPCLRIRTALAEIDKATSTITDTDPRPTK